MGLVLVILLAWCTIGGLVGSAIGSSKGRAGDGFVLGLLLGPFGWLFVAFGPDQSPGVICPACKAKVPVGATKCMHCASEIPGIPQSVGKPSSQQESIATGQAKQRQGLSTAQALLLIGLAVVVLLSVIVGGTFWILSAKRSLNAQNYAEFQINQSLSKALTLPGTSTTPTTVGYPAQDDPKAKKVLRSCVNGQAYAWENGDWVVFSLAGTPMQCHVEK